MGWAGLAPADFGIDLDLALTDGALAVGTVEHFARVAVDADVRECEDDTLLALAGSLERSRRVLEATSLHVLAELEARGLTDERVGLRTGQWLAHETREPIGRARQRVEFAGRLRTEFPAIDRALSEGRISWAHVRVLCNTAVPRIAKQFTAHLPRLIGLAEELAFSPWQQEVRRVAARIDYEGGYRPEDDPEASKLSISRSGTDHLNFLSGVFAGPEGDALREMIERRTDRLYRQAKRDHTATNGELSVPSRAALRAIALRELVAEGHTADPQRTTSPTTDLTIVLRPDEHGILPRTVSTMDGDSFQLADLAARLCDPLIRFVELDDNGVPLRLGRSARFATPDLRAAVHLRDMGCVFPGCDRPCGHCDLHHVQPFQTGGTTDIDNLACLCRYHHGVTHRKGWEMVATGDGWFAWTTPQRRTLHSQRGQQQRAGPGP